MSGIASGKTLTSAARARLLLLLARLALVRGGQHHAEGDPEQQDAAGDAEGVEADPQLAEQPVTPDGEAQQHDTGDRDGLARDALLLRARALAHQAQEHRHDADGVDDDQERQERAEGELEHGIHGRGRGESLAHTGEGHQPALRDERRTGGNAGAGETRPPPGNRYFFGSSFFTASALPDAFGVQKSGSAEATSVTGVPSLGLKA